MADCFVGCCGWREARAKYFTHFPVVELQDTFYEPPSLALATKWRTEAPSHFHFCIKAWQLITHASASPTYRRLKSKLSATELEDVGWFRPTEQVWLAWERTRAIARVLDAKLVLFQCPASFRPTTDNIQHLHQFFTRMEPEAFQLAWEPRGTWPPELIQEICAAYRLVHCVDPFQGNPVTPGMQYWRLHGRGGYSYRYTDEELDHLRRLTAERAAAPVYLLFNNLWMKQDALRFLEIPS